MTQLTDKTVKALILKMHSENLSNAEIARRLLAQGYVSPRTGKPISQFGVGFHVRGSKTGVAKVKLAPAPTSPAQVQVKRKPEAVAKAKGKAALALALLQATELPAALRTELAERVLNA